MAAQHTSPLQALLVDDKFEGEVYPSEPMARHTSYRIGGPSRFFVQVNTLQALRAVITACAEEETPWMIVGKGSNLLVSDAGFDGVCLSLGEDFKHCTFDEERSCFIAGAGMSLAALVQEAFKHSVAGLEFAVGTPGTVGGAVRMNAGSRDEWMSSRLVSFTTFSLGAGLQRFETDEVKWGYRTSSIPADAIVLECEIAVEAAPEPFIRGKMEALLSKRKKAQPLRYPSCGSVFKNPEGHSAGALVEQVGLKGCMIGGAQISELHANFIVNTGGATAADVYDLIQLIQTKVKETYGIELQPEVKFIGSFSEE